MSRDPGWRWLWPGSIDPCLCCHSRPLIIWHQPLQCPHMGTSRGGFSSSPPTYLLDFPYTSELPPTFNHIVMFATICPVLVMHWCVVLKLWSPTRFTWRSWVPYILPNRASQGWKPMWGPVYIGPTCRPALSTAISIAHCAPHCCMVGSFVTISHQHNNFVWSDPNGSLWPMTEK